MTEGLHFHFSLSCIGEGNGTPLQCSCLENPRDGGAWWAASMRLHRVGHDWSDLAAAAAVNSSCRGQDFQIQKPSWGTVLGPASSLYASPSLFCDHCPALQKAVSWENQRLFHLFSISLESLTICVLKTFVYIYFFYMLFRQKGEYHNCYILLPKAEDLLNF